MDANEREQILALLKESSAVLLSAVAGVSDESARRSPAPGRWSILGCVEHLALSEDYFFAQIANATQSNPPLVNLQREAKMLARGADRSRKMESPPEGLPSGAFPTLAAALHHFLESRNRSIEFVRTNQEDLRAKTACHPILKQANCHEMLLSMGLHVQRHVRQIEEIKAELN